MTDVTVQRGSTIPANIFTIGNLVEVEGDDDTYVVLVTSTGDNHYFGGTIVVPNSSAHNTIGYRSEGFAKRCFRQFFGSITLKV